MGPGAPGPGMEAQPSVTPCADKATRGSPLPRVASALHRPAGEEVDPPALGHARPALSPRGHSGAALLTARRLRPCASLRGRPPKRQARCPLGALLDRA